MTALDAIYVDSIVRSALSEDVGSGDITTLLTIPDSVEATATITAKEDGVIAGLDMARATFSAVDPSVKVLPIVRDGAQVKAGDEIVSISGKTRAILTGERVALNFLQRMSGIATLTAKYVSLVSHTKARIVDTRKTTPGLRRLEKYAVTVGGGFNHRFGLSDGILIKDNHIAAAGGVRAAVALAKKHAPHTLQIEVEVTRLSQLEEAIESGADIVLLDNMDLGLLYQAVQLADDRITLEASGGINESTVAEIAETGVHIISVGALTHSPRALDLSLNIDG